VTTPADPPAPAPVSAPEPPVSPEAPAEEKPTSPRLVFDLEQDGPLLVLDTPWFQLWPVTLLQTQIALYAGEHNLLQDGDPAEQAGFRLRRARFGVGAELMQLIDLEVSTELSGKSATLLDAWIAYRKGSELGFTLGVHKVPFSRYLLAGTSQQSFLERPLAVTAMAPDQQPGITVHGSIGGGLFTYALGVFNGFERQPNFFEGYQQNPGFEGNRLSRLAYVARVTTEPLGSLGDGLVDLDHGDFRFGVGGSFFYNDGKTTRGWAVEADLLLKVQGFHLMTEFLFDSAEPQDDPTTELTLLQSIDRMAWVAEVGYCILPRQLGVVLRAEVLDDDRANDNSGDQLVLTGGLQYYVFRHHLKVTLDYSHRLELFGPELDNGSLLIGLQVDL
jgi:hypothetical protein